MPRAGGNIAPRLEMFEYQNLDWDTANDVPIDPIVINDWYIALAEIRNVKAWYLIIEQTNNGATDETIVTELTINGVVYTSARNQVSGQPYYQYLTLDGVIERELAIRQIVSLDNDQSAPLETRSLAIRVRQTTAVDAISAIIEVNLVYDTLEETE